VTNNKSVGYNKKDVTDRAKLWKRVNEISQNRLVRSALPNPLPGEHDNNKQRTPNNKQQTTNDKQQIEYLEILRRHRSLTISMGILQRLF